MSSGSSGCGAAGSEPLVEEVAEAVGVAGDGHNHALVPSEPGTAALLGDAGVPWRYLFGICIAPRLGLRSDDPGEVAERRSDSELELTVEPELVVSAAEILLERVSGDDHLCGWDGPEPAHGS